MTSRAAVRLGVVVVDPAAIAKAFGSDKTIDVFAEPKELVAYVNAHGGINGRQIKAVYVSEDISKDSQQAGQDACVQLTQDNKVDIVLNVNLGSETLYACLKQKGVSVFTPTEFVPDATYQAQYNNNFMPLALPADQYYPALIKDGVQRGVLKQGSKLGILTESCPWATRLYDNVLTPLAKQYGIGIEVATTKCVTNLLADITPVTNDVQRAVLKFHQDGVTAVIGVSGVEAFLIIQFTSNASQQKYFPKYLLTSNANVYNNSNASNTVHFSPDAKPNMSGLGFQPLLDVGGKARPTADQAAALKKCQAATPKAVAASDDGTDGKYFALSSTYSACDGFFAIVDTLRLNGVRFGLADVTSGFQTMLGRTFSATIVGGHYHVGSRPTDGAGFAQPLKYDAASTRFVYSGPVRAVS